MSDTGDTRGRAHDRDRRGTESFDEASDPLGAGEERDGIGELLQGPSLPAHLYVHVPFCRRKCGYCDFYSVPVPHARTVAAVLRGIESQIAQWADLRLPGVVETVYVGGGTPTVMGRGTLVHLLEAVYDSLPVRQGAEVTVEANPESLTEDLPEALASAGVTRVSLGAQSFDDAVLSVLGRPHSAEDALRAARSVRDAELDLAIDLMCGVPGQSLASWRSTVECAVDTGAGHVSVYPLSVERDTPLAFEVASGLVDEPDPDLAADMMLLAEELLANAGLARYEVASYARDGRESRHNVAYWTARPYVGVGPSAHSMLDVDTARAAGLYTGTDLAGVARVRHANAADVDGWLYRGEGSVETLTAAEAAREDVMLGLRLTRGVDARMVEVAGLGEVLEGLAEEGFVELVGVGGAARWRTTTQGWLLGNEVFGDVWCPDE